MGESALTGSDVITETITGNRRIQAGMKMSNGSVNFDERRGKELPLAQNAMDELDDRFIKSDGDRYNV
tara:strand:- start:10946 stop:11149 length:204 start_codon:yes stop_codon:yes gene_type:complete